MSKFGARCAIVAIAGTIAACSTTPPPKTETPAPAPVAKAAEVPKPAPSVQSKPAPAPAPVAVNPLAPYLDPNNPISTDRSVFFAFDRADVMGDGSETVMRQGNYLASAAKVAVRIEGNCDERGSREYNLALGQRRADSVAGRLRAMGVRGSQLETVSYGKEKPRASGHSEDAWKQNRRADIVYAMK